MQHTMTFCKRTYLVVNAAHLCLHEAVHDLDPDVLHDTLRVRRVVHLGGI